VDGFDVGTLTSWWRDMVEVDEGFGGGNWWKDLVEGLGVGKWWRRWWRELLCGNSGGVGGGIRWRKRVEALGERLGG
jgi:hypothetical protein